METIVLYLLWTITAALLRGRPRRYLARVTALLGLLLILLYTVIGRGASGIHILESVPWITFEKAKTEPEYYRTMYMNMLLFLPLGLSLPFALPKRWKYKALIAAAGGCLLSAIVEVVQYYFGIGNCETDDVLMNTLGILIGVSSFGIVCLIQKIRKQ